MISPSFDMEREQAYNDRIIKECSVVTVRKMTPEDEKLFSSRRLNKSEKISGVAGIEGFVNNRTRIARSIAKTTNHRGG
jgi:hypothetical protein